MNPIVRNILAVVAGLIIGGLINGGIVSISGQIIPLPEGVNPNDINSINANIHLYQPIHFLFPFLAHALGTLTGAFVAAKVGATNQLRLALIVGFFFFLGGVAASKMIAAPIWFIALDLLGAYVPMAWLGNKLAGR